MDSLTVEPLVPTYSRNARLVDSHALDNDFPQLEHADLRSKKRIQDRLHKQKEKKAWHARADMKRDNPSMFWASYKPCYICMRMQRETSRARKHHDRGNKRRIRINQERRFDDRTGVEFCYSLSEIFSSSGEDDDLQWYMGWLGRKELLHEEFIEKWFQVDYKFRVVDDPWRPHQPYELMWECDAVMRAWLGCDKDDFWSPFYDEECKRVQDERYRYVYENIPGWVGEKYYDLTPIFVRSRVKQCLTRTGYKVDELQIENSVASPVVDWIIAEYISDSDLDFESLSNTEAWTDSEWEEIGT